MRAKNIVIAVAALAIIGLGAFFIFSPDVPGQGGIQALAMGETAADPGAEQIISSSNSDEAWFVRCNKDKDGKELAAPKKGACEVFQRLIQEETKGRIIEFAIGYPAGKDEARGILVLPLGINLLAGAQMQIDEGKSFSVQVRYCDANGCYAFLDANNELLSMMKKGSKMAISVQSMKPQNVRIEMQLKGFEQALKQVS